jgi:hypothetical protein
MIMVLFLMMIKDPTLGWWLGAGSCLAIAGWDKLGRQFNESGASQPRGRLRYPWSSASASFVLLPYSYVYLILSRRRFTHLSVAAPCFLRFPFLDFRRKLKSRTESLPPLSAEKSYVRSNTRGGGVV